MPTGRPRTERRREVAETAVMENFTSEETADGTIEIGGMYMVAWRNGQQHPAKIIVQRQSQEGARVEYYVHYIHHDRRLDEWVGVDRIDLTSGVGTISDLHDIGPHGKNKKTKRKLEDMTGSSSFREEKVAILSQLEKEHEETTKVKNIQRIELGRYEMDTWYFSAYPDDYSGVDKLYSCEYCLKYMKSETTMRNHRKKCQVRAPPGRQIYLEDEVSMFEIDGKDHKIYCQNLCLLAKLFLDHKTLYYDVDSFLFYVLCEVDASGHHIVGYFSKEKHSAENNNLACILTFPSHQRKGYGKLLISISYELTKREGTTGAPEKPLSDLGKISYRSYWAYVILEALNQHMNSPDITVTDITKATGVRSEDVVSTLHSLNLIKYWKGQHVICISQQIVDSHTLQTKKMRLCDPACLDWEPPVDKGEKKV
jgi:histone acetyltransferase MYST1